MLEGHFGIAGDLFVRNGSPTASRPMLMFLLEHLHGFDSGMLLVHPFAFFEEFLRQQMADLFHDAVNLRAR